ncbi:hypothetical protein FH608_012815 [Nonomuraea phyllanthi]|uniref:Uncharacterized protein n=1 Tax=Nonomuraea phyllanthi TaxID=2219224 RepID=A0A5C4WPH3_9ACTN|nr:hypothetical protein [Nonomuraea phyllanthi]KAB8195246.1 hypothetical protein FH608_012815 [Nonomuraea phyllanthi]
MLIAFAAVGAIVVGAVLWWIRRDQAAGESGDPFEMDVELGLAPELEPAFVEGLRAYPLRAGVRRGVLTTYEPPRLVSLHLLADAFAARGEAALHDPQGTVAALVAQLAAAERPGVLHLRADWPDGEMEPARFAEAVREVIGAEGAWSADEAVGALQLTVRGTNTMMLDLARLFDLYREARDKRSDASVQTLLHEVAPRMIAAGGPGLTWTKPPTREDLRIVLGDAPESG